MDDEDTKIRQALTEAEPEKQSSVTNAAPSDNCYEEEHLPIYYTTSGNSSPLNEPTKDDATPTVNVVESEHNTPAVCDIAYDAYCEEQTSEQIGNDPTSLGSFNETSQDASIIDDELTSGQPNSSNQETDDLEYAYSENILTSAEKTDEATHLFSCCQCSDIGLIVPATISCSDCLELYCPECSDDHKSFKATKAHLLNLHNDLQKKTTCEPCESKGVNSKIPSHLCIECNEAQCHECRIKHQRIRLTRNHRVVPCTSTHAEPMTKPNHNMEEVSSKLLVSCTSTPAEVISKPIDNLEQGPCSVTYASTPEVDIFKLNDSSKPLDSTLQMNINNSWRPGKPYLNSITIDNAVITWEPPEELLEKHSYQLRYKEQEKQTWVYYPETLVHHIVTLHNLKSDAQFVFQVRMINNENEGPYSDQSDPIHSMRSAAEQLLDFMYDVEKPDTGMQLKQVPLHENSKARNAVGKTRKLDLGGDKGVSIKERTILLVGATGTGKSTLVDGMINYVLGVKWSDPYRLTLVNLEEDEQNRNVDQAVSQTQWITCYTINKIRGGRLDYKLTIIDTPGFGDTGGIDRDKEIVQQIQQLFSREGDTGVLSIDAICFVIKAPDARLTPTQMYIFNAIMSLFGQDIEDNFSMLITFADGKQPPVLSALKKANLPHDEYFPFNNSGLFANNSSSNKSDFASMFWDMGCQSFESFFERLSKMETKSLIQTRDVLSQREKIEMTMENLIPLVDAGLTKVEEARIEIAILNDYKTQIEANSDFKYTVTETQQTQIDLPIGKHVTNCLNCHFTCHKRCKYANDEDKRKCSAMDRDGFCEQCPNNCWWDIHRNTPYIFEYVSVTKEKTYAEKLEKYRLATDEKMTREKVVERMHKDMCDLENEIFSLMEQINDCNNILRKIALRPDPLSLVEHIDILIEGEKQEKRPGFTRRIASLQQCRRRATIGDEIGRFDAGFTDATTQITAQVQLHVKRQRKSRKAVLGFFQPVVNCFLKK